jgi:iron complex transport system substrate-binding protein
MAVYVEQGEEDLAGLTSDDIEEIEKVGDVYQPSLEKILSLKSDLILAMYFSHEKIYQQLTAIAPTLIVDFERNYSFKVNLRYLAQIFGKEEEAEKVISQYQARINQLRQKLDRNPEEIKVTLLLRYSGVFGMPHPEHTSHEIFSDIGLQDTINVARTNSVSLEVLPQYAPDILFIMDYENNPESFFLENPLIASLNAVKNNCVYFVDAETWSANGPIGVNRMLDELFKYLPVRSP